MQGEAIFSFNSITLKVLMANKSERWKVIRFDLTARILSIFYLPILKLNRKDCNGLTDSSTLQIADDPKLKNNTRTGSVQDGLRN